VILVAAVAGTLVVLTLFCIDTAQNEPRVFVAMLVIFVLTVIFDFAWKRQRGALVTPSTASP
jgi:hypothetical protein